MTDGLRGLSADLFLTGCAAGMPPDQPADTCGAGLLRRFVGFPATAVVPLPGTARLIPPGSAITKDFRPKRVTVDLDAAGVITRVWCG